MKYNRDDTSCMQHRNIGSYFNVIEYEIYIYIYILLKKRNKKKEELELYFKTFVFTGYGRDEKI